MKAAPLTAVFAAVFFCASALAASSSDGLDELDRQELVAHIERAKGCIQLRDFACSEQQLAKARSFANTNADRDALQRAWQAHAYAKQMAPADDARQKYAAQQATLQAGIEARQRDADETARQSRAEARAMARDIASNQQQSAPAVSYGAAVQQGMNAALADRAAIDKIHNQAIANVQNTIAERQRREQAQRDREAAQQQLQRQEQQERRQQLAAQQMRAQQEQDRRAQELARAAQASQERALREEEARREAVARAEEKKAREQQAEQARREQVARQESEKAAKIQAQSQYLAEVKRQFRLKATTCPDGEGKYYAVGVNPNIKPQVVACYGIQFRAQCRGGGISAYGGTKHFASMSASCFAGESVVMEPKLACKPEDVQITVTEVTPCP